MGLDMTLYRIPKGYATQEDVEEFCNFDNADYERSEVLYWRKFNALHYWMVENVQNGVDECQPHLVTKADLEKLLSTLLSVNEGNAEVVFPTCPGFFFGSTEYGDYFFSSVAATAQSIAALLEEFDFENGSLFYLSSW